jgi:phosphoesterase RecJ-like protein
MTKRTEELKSIISAIPAKGNVAIFPHSGVDGDGLGSTLALKFALKAIGVNAHVFTDNPIPKRFEFLPGIDEIIVFPENTDMNLVLNEVYPKGKIDMGILIDCASSTRIGACEKIFHFCPARAIIDHHATVFCTEDFCCIDSKACASGELVYDFIKVLEDTYSADIFSQEIATAIMTTIYSDTGGFFYSNTNAKAFNIASKLFTEFKIDTRSISYNLFERTTIAKILLESKAFETTYFLMDNKIAICLVTKQMILECGANDNDVDGICAELRNIEGVVVAFVLREKDNGEIRGNIRSSDEFDASLFAVSLGGGGHMRASGFTLREMTLSQAYDLVAAKSVAMVKKAEGRV